MVPIVLAILGMAFIMIEIFLPGFGFFGITGIIMLMLSCVISIIFSPYGIFLVLGIFAAVILLLYVVWKKAKKMQLTNNIILHETLAHDKLDIGGLDYFLGKDGITKTPLKPFGSVDFNGVSIDVYADGEYIRAGERVKVINVSNNKVIVKRVEHTINI